MIYNGIGLQTHWGSGTSGYVQVTAFNLKAKANRDLTGPSKDFELGPGGRGRDPGAQQGDTGRRPQAADISKLSTTLSSPEKIEQRGGDVMRRSCSRVDEIVTDGVKTNKDFQGYYYGSALGSGPPSSQNHLEQPRVS
ncbi:pre-mRNA-splicing factor CWC21 [Striga asiatica]|uniref:Pre-mRNA-splicing factor CWC21 n=1 Tax=Striga asiatica TaxID=4170 RepID=A0A5A7RFC8_STRAF|nr:pre-mRNA-splicing factor CWC21 [Striga asiatica]